MIGLIDGICIYDDISENSDEMAIVEGATMGVDIGPFKAGELVPHLQLVEEEQVGGEIQTFLTEVDGDGVEVRRCRVRLEAV